MDMKNASIYQFMILLVLSTGSLSAQIISGGPLSQEQAAYDVTYYHLDLAIEPVTKTISGSLLCQAGIVNPIQIFVLDLYNLYSVDSVLFKKNNMDFSSVSYTHANGQLTISLTEQAIGSELVAVKVFYSGVPPISAYPPWEDGFVWAETPESKPWIGVACESSGADIWWPCKDHPTDEPDSMAMSFTVPNPLMCISNGQFKGSIDNGDGTSTYNWFNSTSINNYNVTFYAAEYLLIEDDYTSTIGHTIPFYFWVLPQDYDKALDHMDLFKSEFDFLESIYGPFPFGTDKHGFAHASYLGMEHQSVIAYGSDFTVNGWGYDRIHLHELAHEWWGNLITAKDWADLWIHEGIATYSQALCIEDLNGLDTYLEYMKNIRPLNNHLYPLAPRGSLWASQAFDNLNPYYRGASVMHTLRYHLGDDTFFNLLKRWVYPNSSDYDNTRGRLCRIVSTDDLKAQAEAETGRDLDPFFEVFFREADYPVLSVVRKPDTTLFAWETEGNIGLDLDIPVVVNDVEQRVEMMDGVGFLAISSGDKLVIDPNSWILMDTPSITGVRENRLAHTANYRLEQNYPNPFHLSSTISFTIPEPQHVTLKLYNSLGKELATLVDESVFQGKHEVHLNGTRFSKGVYFYTIHAGGFTETRSFIVE